MLVVFGSGGFIGARLGARLERRGISWAGASSAQCDLSDARAVGAFLDRCGRAPLRIVNLAVVGKFVDNTLSGFKRNIAMTAGLLEALRTREVASLVYASSLDVYGSTLPNPLTEESPTHPVDWYGLSKLTSENMCSVAEGIAPILSIVRLPGVYAPDASDASVVSRFWRRIRAGETITVYGSGAALRDHVCVEDVCDVLETLALRDTGVGLLNVGTGESRSILSLIGLMGQAYGVTPSLAFSPDPSGRDFDIVLDTAKLTAALPTNTLAPLATWIRAFPGAIASWESPVSDGGVASIGGNDEVHMALKKYSTLKIFHFPEKIHSLPKEREGRQPPLHIRIKPTNFCNHACAYCAYRQEGTQIGKDMNERDFIPWEKMSGFIEDIAAMQVKALTFSGGGEPLCYPFIQRTLLKLADTDIRIAMLSNGSLLSGEVAEILAHRGSWVRISIDGWDASSYARYRKVSPGEFGKVMGNMEAFKKIGGRSPLGVSMIIDHDNAPHVFSFAKRLKDAGADSLKVSPCIVSNSHDLCNLYHRSIFDQVREGVERIINELAGPEFEVSDAYHALDERFDKDYHWCPFLQVQPVLGADMNIYTCHDKAYNLDSGLLGSIREKSFREVWMGGGTNFFAIDPTRDCKHHCCNNKGNKLVLEYLAASDPDHVCFV